MPTHYMLPQTKSLTQKPSVGNNVLRVLFHIIMLCYVSSRNNFLMVLELLWLTIIQIPLYYVIMWGGINYVEQVFCVVTYTCCGY